MIIHLPRHRHGRPVAEILLDAAVVDLARATRAEPRGHRRRLAERDARVAARIGTRADPRVFNAASSAQLDANDVVAEIVAMRNRVRTAALIAGREFTGRRNTTAELHNGGAHIQKAQKALTCALDAIDRAVLRVARAEEAVQQFHPHGGTRVASIPTRRVAVADLARALNALDVAHQLAGRTTVQLDLAVAEARDSLVRAGRLVDRAAGAPPRALRLLRLGMPPSERSEWWRELCSTFAECTPGERTRNARSYLLGAPRTLWTGWTTARRTAREPARRSDDG